MNVQGKDNPISENTPLLVEDSDTEDMSEVVYNDETNAARPPQDANREVNVFFA